MPDLPRPKVEVVTTDSGQQHVVISRDGKAKSYAIVGTTTTEKVEDAVRNVINDGHTAEWLPH